MNKKKIQTLIVAGLLTTNAMTPLADTLIKVKSGSETQVGRVIKAEKGHVYLSDIDYESESRAGWGEIRKDTNVEGNSAIKLIIEGETVEFGKGMAAHANSTLIYDLSEHVDTYSKLTTYLGVDASRGSNGDGVRFTISISNDKTTWNTIYESKVLKGNMDSEYVELDLQGAKYVKLYAHRNGNDAADHSVYGDLKLVKEDYVQASGSIQGLESVATYDSILNANSVEENIANNESTILKRTFVNRLGYGTLKRIADQDVKYANALNYLINDIEALRYFVYGGKINMHGSYLQSFKAFADIYEKYEADMSNGSDDNFNLRLAISIALSHSRKETTSAWIKSNQNLNPVHRYEVYQHLVASGKMDIGGNTNDHKKWSTAEFKALPVTMMRWVVDTRLNNDEILWLVDYALKEKEAGRNYFDAYNYIEYTMDHSYERDKYYDENNRQQYNDKYGFDNYFSDYGDRSIARLWMAFEDGGVCGALAQTYATLAEVFGRPSSPVGQPGHAATLTYEWNKNNNRYEWVIQNDIDGWGESGNQFDDRMLGWGDQWKNSWSTWVNASYTVLASDAVMDYNNYTKATLLSLLAESYTDNNMKKECYSKALGHQKIHLDAWEGLINAYRADSNATSQDFLELGKGIIESYNYYPQTMVELLTLVEPLVTDAGHLAQLDILKNNALVRASQATPQQSTCVNMTKQMANRYLRNNQSTELATFSFDGENANCIVLNSKYEGSSIRVRYSLDNKRTWKETDQHIIQLSEDEIASITADNDIIVGLVGTDATHTIDILAGKTITDTTLYANDEENVLTGAEADLQNLEFSTDGGTTWCNYIGGVNSDMKFTGNQTIKVRYKANGVYLRSSERGYVFTEDAPVNEQRKYISLRNVTLVDCAAPNSATHKGEHMIDGSIHTGYHTRFGHNETNKFYTVKFDQPRNITSLEYLFTGGNNGKIKDGKIFTSMDGENWTEVKSFTLSNREVLETIDLDEPVKCQYVKVVADTTHGDGRFLAGRMLRFYEDTTVLEMPEDDLDNDMMVNPDEDQVVEDTPVTLPDDFEVDTNNPNDDFVDDNMGVDPDNVPVDSDDIPTILPDDIPVDTTDTPVVLPDDAPVEEVKPNIPPIEDMTPDGEGWVKTTTFNELIELWDYTINEDEKTVVLNNFKGTVQRNGEVKVEVPRTIEGYKAVLADLKSDMFQGVTHIKVAEAKDGEGQVKVLATNLVDGFKNNDTLKYVDLEGLDVSSVDDMYGLFSFCKNLRVINISDWVIKDTTNITAMFYAKKDSTDVEKKILVISNDTRINQYDYRASNRMPRVVLFSGEGGHFLGDEGILNMAAARYVIRPEVLDNLDKVIEEDLIFAGKPSREGYEFKGWYTDDATPTNFYELLNMTYKAKWEKVEEAPEIKDYEVEAGSGSGGSINTPAIIKINNLNGLRHIIDVIVTENKMSVGISDRTEEADVISYKLDVIDGRNAYHIVLKVDKTNTKVTDVLDDLYDQNNSEPEEELPETDVPDTEEPPVEDDDNIDEIPPVEDGDNGSDEEGGDTEQPEAPETPEQPPVEDGEGDDNDSDKEDTVQDIEVENKVDKAHVIKVNTKDGLDKVLEWLNTNMSYDREVDVIINEDTNIATYRINVFHHDMTVSYIDIKVSSDDKELIEILDEINTVLPPEEETPEIPGEDFDNDMEVNPDSDQVVDDTPVTLPDDVPVDTDDIPVVLPDDVPVDTTDKPVTLPDDVPVDTDDTPVTLPDDVPVDTDDTPVTLPDDVPVEDVETPSEPSDPEIPEFEHEVIEIGDGNGEAENPLELIIKDVLIDTFNAFLNELKALNTKVISVTTKDDSTLYVIKFDRIARNSGDSMYAVIRVENSRTEVINALNEFAKENNTSIKDEVVLDGTHMDNNMVTPENNDTISDDKKPNTESIKPSTNTSDSTTVSNTNKKPSKLPQTGNAVGVGAYLLLGISSILGGLGLKKKNKK